MTEDEAKQRFFALAALRLGGVVLALTGVWLVVKRPEWEVLGYLLIVFGAFDVLVLPQLLVRRWKR